MSDPKSISLNDFEFEKKLGEGSYGSVWKVRVKKGKSLPFGLRTGAFYALKVYHGLGSAGRKDLSQEVEMLAQLSASPHCHSSLACYHGSFEDSISKDTPLQLKLRPRRQTQKQSQVFAIVMQYIEGFDLWKFIGCQEKALLAPLPVEYMKPMMEQLLEAVAYIHEKGIVHRDIKSENIMYTSKQVYLVDFGLACDTLGVSHPCKSIAGTSLFWPPEIRTTLRAPRTIAGWKAQDIWALGAVFYELLTLQIPTKCVRQRNLMYPDPQVLRVVQLALRCPYADRPSAAQLLKILRSKKGA